MKLPVESVVRGVNKKEVIKQLNDCLRILNEQRLNLKNIVTLLQNKKSEQQGYILLLRFIQDYELKHTF